LKKTAFSGGKAWYLVGRQVRTAFYTIPFAGAALIAALCNARADDQIRTYTVPKEHPSVAAPDIPVNATPIHWTVPEGWQQLAATSIRLGNFVIPGKNGAKAEVTVTSFPGRVGTDLDNVNRWRRELGLEPVEESGVSSEPVTVDALEGKLFDFTGTSAQTVVASISRQGASWFFKMRGDTEVVNASKPAFAEFLKSVRFSGAVNDAQAPVAAAAVPAPAPTARADSASDSPKWEVPADWAEAAPGPMIFKRFSVADAGGAKASVTVSFFPGEVGGVLANVNRWRGQMGLEAVETDKLASVTETLETAGGKATLVDFPGTDAKTGQPARLLGAIVPHGDQTWFYKLLGDASLAGKQKDSFVHFVKGVQYP
jgi:hypothetical protein